MPGEWGIRIEDIVVVTETGVEPLNTSAHTYRVVACSPTHPPPMPFLRN